MGATTLAKVAGSIFLSRNISRPKRITAAALSSRPVSAPLVRTTSSTFGSTPAFRAAIPSIPTGIESLGFFDVRQLLALGEQTGLTAEDLRPVRAASAVIQREEDDTTAEFFFEIP